MKRQSSKASKIKTPRMRMSKKKLLVLFVALLILAVLAGYGITDRILAEKASEEKTAEGFREEQGEEKENAEGSGLGDLENRLAADFIKTLQGEQYFIKYRTTTVYEGASYEVETTFAVSGKSIAMVSADRATIVKDNKVFMLNHTDKTIISWKVTQTDNLKRIDAEGLVYLGSSEAGGLVCEEYTTAAQARIRIYFSGNELKKVATAINRQDIVMDIVEVSKEVPESLFVVPAGYQITNLSNSTGSQ